MSTHSSRNSSGSASASTSLSTTTKSNKTSLFSTATSPSASTATTTSPFKSSTQISKLSPSTFESLLDSVHKTAKQTAKQDNTAEEVLLAKLACYAVRELHAEGIYPITALRAMTILEFSTKKRSTGGVIKQAKREVRDEHRILREGRGRDAVGDCAAGAEDGEVAGDTGVGKEEGFDGEGDGGFGGDHGVAKGVLVELTRD